MIKEVTTIPKAGSYSILTMVNEDEDEDENKDKEADGRGQGG